MKNSYVYEVIHSLNNKEKAELGVFLASPYFNASSTQTLVAQLFGILSQQNLSLKKEDVFSEMFPGQVFINGKLDKLMSELNKLIGQFLLTNYYLDKSNAFNQALDTARLLRERNLMSRYPKAIKLTEKILNGNKESTDYYANAYKLAFEKHVYESHENKIKGDLAIPETIEALDKSYIGRRFELLNLLLLQQKIISLKLATHLNDEYFYNFAQRHINSAHPLLEISGKVNEQLSREKPEYTAIQEIIQLLRTHEDKIDREALNNYYAYLRSICAMLLRKGEKSTLHLLHEIHQDNLRNGLLFYQEKLPPSTYLNVAKVAISVGQTDWAFDFVEKHQTEIFTSEDPLPYYQLNKALCLFATGKYEEALAILPDSFTDMVYMLNLRRLELKIYYELDSTLLPYKIDAQKMYVSRISKKLISNDTREIEGNFINILLQIHQCPPFDQNRIARITERVQEKDLIAEKEWLLEKLERLKEKGG